MGITNLRDAPLAPPLPPRQTHGTRHSQAAWTPIGEWDTFWLRCREWKVRPAKFLHPLEQLPEVQLPEVDKSNGGSSKCQRLLQPGIGAKHSLALLECHRFRAPLGLCQEQVTQRLWSLVHQQLKA